MSEQVSYARIRNVTPFQYLLRSMVERYGSMTRVCREIGISTESYTKLVRDDELGVSVARKILDHYNGIQSERAA